MQFDKMTQLIVFIIFYMLQVYNIIIFDRRIKWHKCSIPSSICGFNFVIGSSDETSSTCRIKGQNFTSSSIKWFNVMFSLSSTYCRQMTILDNIIIIGISKINMQSKIRYWKRNQVDSKSLGKWEKKWIRNGLKAKVLVWTFKYRSQPWKVKEHYL